jgi:hypothetical protein
MDRDKMEVKMSIDIRIEAKKNKVGNKSYYCWDGDVFLVAKKVDKWQDVIFGYYKDKEDLGWNLGIKRNKEKRGRSSFYYQVVSPPLAKMLLTAIKKETNKQSYKAAIDIMIGNLGRSDKDDNIMNNINELL